MVRTRPNRKVAAWGSHSVDGKSRRCRHMPLSTGARSGSQSHSQRPDCGLFPRLAPGHREPAMGAVNQYLGRLEDLIASSGKSVANTIVTDSAGGSSRQGIPLPSVARNRGACSDGACEPSSRRAVRDDCEELRRHRQHVAGVVACPH
jgi:hypothetical protein